MTNNLFVFPETGAKVRVVQLDGAPWFVAADVCRAMGFNMSSGTTHVTSPLRPEERRRETAARVDPENFMGTPDGGLNASTSFTLISESGLYKIALRAQRARPEVAKFQDWVTRDVLPAIRKDGVYVRGEEMLKPGVVETLDLTDIHALNDQIQALLSRKADMMEARALAAEATVAIQAPAVAVFETHYAKAEGKSLSVFARTLDGVNSQAIKRDLTRLGYLYKRGSDPYRVYSQHRGKLFEEKRNFVYGGLEIYPTKEGQKLIVELFQAGRLTMRVVRGGATLGTPPSEAWHNPGSPSRLSCRV